MRVGSEIEFPPTRVRRGTVVAIENVTLLDQINGAMISGQRYWVCGDSGRCSWVYEVQMVEWEQPGYATIEKRQKRKNR